MTRLWREGCGIALWAMNFIYRLAAGGGAPSNDWGSPLFIKLYNYGHTLSGVRVQRIQRIHRVQRVVVMGGCAASINKTFTTALAGGGNALPLWWLAPPPSPPLKRWDNKTFTTGLRPWKNHTTALTGDGNAPLLPPAAASLHGKACHWIFGSLHSPTNPVPLPPRRGRF